MIKKLNLFFFSEEEISAHDSLWFYGGYSVFLGISAIGLIAAQI